MLLKITESCHLGCIHCLNDAKPCDHHMTIETLNGVLEFMERMVKDSIVMSLIITGGEPTEHPEFEKILCTIQDWSTRLRPRVIPLYVTTNGFYISENCDWARAMVRRCPGMIWQVSTDHRYYPEPLISGELELWREPGFEFFSDCVDMLTPMGRARNMKHKRKCTSCFNVRSVVRSGVFDTLGDVIQYMELQDYHCTPGINYKGELIVGESDLCKPVGSVLGHDPDEMFQKICKFQCKGCEHLLKLMDRRMLYAIGEEI